MATRTNWAVPTVDDVNTVMNTFVVGSANEQFASGDVRVTKLLSLCVNIVRGAIGVGGRSPISLTPGSVPPEAVDVVLMLVVERLINSTPRLAKFVESDWAGWTIKDARDWVKEVRQGQAVTQPADPDPSTVPIGVVWGDYTGLEIGQVGTATVAAGGTGYVLGDVLTIPGGNGVPAQLTVTGVDGGGAVTVVAVTFAGNYSDFPVTSAVAATGGNGSGAKFNLTTSGFAGKVDMTT